MSDSRETVTYEWEVWQRRNGGDAETARPVLELIGTYQSRYANIVTDDDVAAIGRLADGPGTFLCICGESARRVTIAEDRQFVRVEDEGAKV